MSDKKNNKKKLLWITLGALGLAIAGTATGVAISKSLSKDKVKDKRESLKEILADKNLSIPSNMKEYLQELSQSESFDNSLNIEDIKSSLINWTVIEKYSKELENEKVNIEFIEFLENTNNLKINDVKAEKNNLEKLLNNKNANSNTELINNKSKIKELENQLGQFASGTQNSQEDFNQIKAILSKNPPIISSDSIDSYKTTMKNDYKANSSLKSSLKNIIDIDSKARELISVANEIKAKETKNEKQHAALIKFANIFNDSNQVKEDKFADSSLLEEMIILISDFNNALKPENPNSDSGNVNNNPSQDGGEEKTIEQEKNEAKAFVSSLEKLSDGLKIKYSEKINDLTISASIKEVKDRASSYNQVVDKIISAISKANEVKQTQKYNNASNKDEFDAKLVEIQNLLEENKLKTNDEFLELNSKLEDIKNDLEKLEELKNELNGDISSDKINEFKSMVENSLTSSISDKVSAYGMENLLYSASITSENKPLFISENEVDGVELEFKNVYVSVENINELNVVYKAKSKTDESLVTEVTEKVLFSNDFNEKVNAITFTNLDELFEFEYNDFSKYFESDLVDKKNEILEIFKKKLNNVNGFFTYKINDETISFENNKISLNVEFWFNNKKFKNTKLSTLNNVSLKDNFWKGISITMSHEFKSSEFYNDPDNFFVSNYSLFQKQGSVFNAWFTKNIFNIEKDKNPNLINKTLESKVNLIEPTSSSNNSNALTVEEIKQIMENLKSEMINKLFNINVDSGITYELINFDNNVIFESTDSPFYSAKFKFNIFKNGQPPRELIVPVTSKLNNSDDQDVKDLNFLKSLIETSDKEDPSKLYEFIKVKDKNKTHNQFNSKDAIKVFNENYELPKRGRFQLYAHSLEEFSNVASDPRKSSEGATAKIRFWITEDGQPLNEQYNKYKLVFQDARKNYRFGSFSKKIKYFKPLSYRDIKPLEGSEWFTQNDFIESETKVSDEDKNIINSITSRSFLFRKTEGSVGKKTKLYALVDPKDIIEQKAFEMINYVLKLNDSSTKESEDSSFSNTKPGTVADDKPINTNTSNDDFYTSNDVISAYGESLSNSNFKKLINDYFMYFYDVTSDQDNSLSFKLGFINKQDTKKRFTNGQTIKLINLRNDYKENLYPQVLLNRIKISDFTFRPGILSLNEFAGKVRSNSQEIQTMFSWKENSLSYKNYSLSKENISVDEVKSVRSTNGTNSIYIKFKYLNPVSNKVYKGNNWYKVSGFSDTSFETTNSLLFENNNLKTIFDSENSIKRERILEPYYKDTLWSFNKSEEKAFWTLDEKYIRKTLLQDGSRDRKIKVQLFGNLLIQDLKRLTRISGQEKGYSFEFDFERMMNGETLTSTIQTYEYTNENTNSSYPRPHFTIRAKYISGEGIKLEVEMVEKEFKLFLGNPYAEAITSKELSTRYGEFSKEKAFLLNHEGAQISVVYTNSIEHEEFNQETNLFDYKHLDYNQENQPITFYTPEEVINSKEYNPNQNVSYELHNGYLQDQEYMHSSWKNIDLVNNVRARSFAYNRGTATQIAKVSKDPNDLRYYIITNNHVQHIDSFSQLQGDRLAHKHTAGYITKTSNNFGNNVDAGFSYWGGLNTANNIPIELIWSGVDQKNKKGEQVNGQNVDITIFAVDVKELIKNARREGKFDLALWFENWASLKDTTLDFSGVKKGVYFGQNLKRFGMSGFPYGKQSGYYLNRAASSTTTVGLIRQNGYVPTFYNAGNSGTGILGDDNEYISTINSGAPLTFLQSWNNEHSTMNYFGINYDNEHPLDLKNTNSLAAQIIRWHLTKPSEVSMPWFLRDIKKEK